MKPASTIATAAMLLIAGNFFASLSDVSVKLLNGAVSPFQYVFIRQLLCILLLLPFWIGTTKQRRCLGNIKVTLFRAHLLLAGSAFLVVALSYLPLATANAVFYTAPLIMLPLSAWMLGENIQAVKIFATLMGFIGVIIILRPSQFHWAAIFALGCAFALALYNVTVKKLPLTQPVSITLFWTCLLSIPVAGMLAAIFWQPITWFEVGLIAVSAVLTLAYHGCAVFAFKNSAPSNIALFEYSGLIFVTCFGIIWFDEYPDIITVAGIMLIVLPMLSGLGTRQTTLS